MDDIKVLIGQGIGLCMVIVCIVLPQFKERWQMALCAVIANALSGTNFLLLGLVGSCGTAVVSMLQASFAVYHAKREKDPSRIEIAVFALLYITGGILPYIVSGSLREFGWVDVLPISGSLFFSANLVSKDEQHMRRFLLASLTCYCVYDTLVFSTQLFAHVFSLVSVIIALFRYRKQIKG